MALGALGVSALGTGLGSLLGSSIAGEPELGFRDVAQTSTVTQLNPQQLQQILNDLTQAEQTGRGDISSGVAQALGFLTGDTGVAGRQQAIQEATRRAIADGGIDIIGEPVRDLFSGRNPGLEPIYDAIQNNLSSIVDFSGDSPKLVGDAQSRIERMLQTNPASKGVSLGVQRGVVSNAMKDINNVLANPEIQENFRRFASQAGQQAETQLRETNPELFSTESSTVVSDPFLAQNQDINLSALRQMQALSGLTGEDPAAVQARLEATPGFQFRMDQGQQAVERAGSARGLLESGAILKGLTEFGQGLASQEFGAEHDRLAKLAGLTGNAGIVGASQAQTNRLGVADLLANQGSGLASIAQAAAQNRSSALQNSGQRTQEATQSQLFNLNNLTRI